MADIVILKSGFEAYGHARGCSIRPDQLTDELRRELWIARLGGDGYGVNGRLSQHLTYNRCQII
jgi:hypothetical protein